MIKYIKVPLCVQVSPYNIPRHTSFFNQHHIHSQIFGRDFHNYLNLTFSYSNTLYYYHKISQQAAFILFSLIYLFGSKTALKAQGLLRVLYIHLSAANRLKRDKMGRKEMYDDQMLVLLREETL